MAAKAHERKKLERLCCYISHPTVSEKWLKRVFGIDIETCCECGGAVKVIACIEDPVVIRKILDHLRKKIEPNVLTPWPETRAPPAGRPMGLARLTHQSLTERLKMRHPQAWQEPGRSNDQGKLYFRKKRLDCDAGSRIQAGAHGVEWLPRRA